MEKSMESSRKRVICNAFAFQEGYQTSLQLGGKADEEMLVVYMKNIFVSLKSAKLHNPQDAVLLVTNQEVPAQFAALFAQHDIQTMVVPFDRFVMPKKYVWALAYFKLCALSYVLERTDYEKILLMDADTVTTASYEQMWQEADYELMLYPVGHSFHHKDRVVIRKDYQRLYPDERKNLVHYGGEYICGSRQQVGLFVKNLEAVYNEMKRQDFPVAENAGDETVLSIAAAHMPRITEASAYLARYWTEAFYLVSTNTTANPVVIWHIPNEKKTGFVTLYHYYERYGAFPSVEKLRKIFGMGKDRRPWNYYTIRNKVLGKWRTIAGKRN